MIVAKKPYLFPAVLFIFTTAALVFTVVYQVQEFVDQYRVQHELPKRIFRRLQEEGLEIPFPQRTVYLREEKAWNK